MMEPHNAELLGAFIVGLLCGLLAVPLGVFIGFLAAKMLRPMIRSVDGESQQTEEVNEKGLGALLRRKPPCIDQEKTE